MAGWAAAAKDNPGHALVPSSTRPMLPLTLTGLCESSQSEKLEQSAGLDDGWGDSGGRDRSGDSVLDPKLRWLRALVPTRIANVQHLELSLDGLLNYQGDAETQAANVDATTNSHSLMCAPRCPA
jgi:hypothetical protein